MAVFGAHLCGHVINTVYMLYIIWNKFIQFIQRLCGAPKFRVIHACASACSERPHILLHYSDSARFLMSPHIKLVCIGLFSTSRSSFNVRLYVTTSHPVLWAPPQLTKVISQSHVNAHMHYFQPLSCTFLFFILQRCSTMARHVHLT